MNSDGLDLMATLIERNAIDQKRTTDSVIEGWKYRALRAEAELEIIRNSMNRILDGQYVPSNRAINNALFPHKSLITTLMDRWERMEKRNQGEST